MRMERKMKREYKLPDRFTYGLARTASAVLSSFVFGRKFLRNELKGKEGPLVVIANHECALDFVNLIGATKRRMTFVISNSFYSSLPIPGLLKKMNLIPKQQFQTSVVDMRKMRTVVENGGILVIYPAGLMCEDGNSTPIPDNTYAFLKWLGTDVYCARTTGSYFCMPKWGKGMRRGRTLMDIYKLFDGEELKGLTEGEVRERAEEAILFDAYAEQEEYRFHYARIRDLSGLENVVYECPNCGEEFTLSVRDGHDLVCGSCGWEQTGDEYGFLHNLKGEGPEIRPVSEWSRRMFRGLKERLKGEPGYVLEAGTEFHTVDPERNAFVPAGEGSLSLSREGFRLRGRLKGEETDLLIPIVNVPALPNKPGKYLEVQYGKAIYRCVLAEGRLAQKFINVLKAFYELNAEAST